MKRAKARRKSQPRVNYQVSSGISEEVREKVEDHEKRITKLEGN